MKFIGQNIFDLVASFRQNVGVGTDSPSYPLEVSGNALISGTTFIGDTFTKIQSAGGSLLLSNLSSSGAIKFRTNSVDVAQINSSGQVGIGTDSPDNILHITKDQGGAASALKLENKAGADNTGFDIDFQLASSGLSAKIGAVRTNSPGAGDSDIFFSTSTNGTSVTEAMRITHDGSVGIGVASPVSKVEIQSSGANGLVLGVDGGNATLSSRLFMTNGTGGQGIALINNAGVFQFLTGSTPDSTSGSEKMRLTSGGNLLIGTTTDSGEKLNVSGNTKITGNLTVSGTTAGIVPKIYGNVIKLIPSDFMDNGDGGNTKFGVAYTDVAGTGYGMRPPNNATELYAFVSIPEGMKATQVDIFDKNNLAIEVFEVNINATTMTSKGTGNCNTTLTLSSAVESTATNFLAIEVTTTSVNDRVYGGKVTIAAI